MDKTRNKLQTLTLHSRWLPKETSLTQGRFPFTQQGFLFLSLPHTRMQFNHRNIKGFTLSRESLRLLPTESGSTQAREGGIQADKVRIRSFSMAQSSVQVEDHLRPRSFKLPRYSRSLKLAACEPNGLEQLPLKSIVRITLQLAPLEMFLSKVL